ncbi:hypothetical protein PUN4_340131 [Paraburkholderia unamae]|nr:hypothetical protein PUN4_340131 [Paraburkholderia unamae]
MGSNTSEGPRDAGANSAACARDYADLAAQVQPVCGRCSHAMFKFLFHAVAFPKIFHAITRRAFRIAIERLKRLWNNGQRRHITGHTVHHGR